MRVHANRYIVRASAFVEGQLMATALAAADQVEIADDQALERLLLRLNLPLNPQPETQPISTPLLGKSPAAPSISPDISLALSSAPSLIALDDPPIADRPIEDIPEELINKTALGPLSAPLTESLNEPVTAVVAPMIEPASEQDWDEKSRQVNRLLSVATPILEPASEVPEIATAPPNESVPPSHPPISPAPHLPSPLATSVQAALDTSPNPVDLSDIIAQTDVEMSRLAWTSQQGREYLEQTFHKRSRQQLTDEELLAFLLYLEGQPTP